MGIRSFWRDATRERIRLEKIAEADYFRSQGVKPHRLEEGEALAIFKDVPSVEAIAHGRWSGATRPTWAKDKALRLRRSA